MEIWGVQGGVSKISIRRCLHTGRNFDLVTGADFTKYHNQRMLRTYVRTHQPLVILNVTTRSSEVDSISLKHNLKWNLLRHHFLSCWRK